MLSRHNIVSLSFGEIIGAVAAGDWVGLSLGEVAGAVIDDATRYIWICMDIFHP